MLRQCGHRSGQRSCVDANRASRSTSNARARSQKGYSLTESLAAIMLATVVILGLAAGILTAVKATRTVSRTQRAEAALTDATEAIKSQAFVPCAVKETYTVPTLPAGANATSATVSSVVYLVPGTDGTTFQPTCPVPATDDVAQRVTVQVGNRSADVIKRNPAT